MSERQPNPPSLFRRIAGYFYRFDDEAPRASHSSKIKTPKPLSQASQASQASQPAQAAQPLPAGHSALSSAKDPEKTHSNGAELPPAASITQPVNAAVEPVEATAPEILPTGRPLPAETAITDGHRP